MSSKTTKERGVIIAVIKDVFFGITVRNTIKRLNYEPQMIKSAQRLMDTVAVYDPSLVIVDLQVIEDESAWDFITATRELDVPVLVFGPHKDVEGLRAAKQAGVSRVVANSQFHREMPILIERYVKGAEEKA
jgi:DNA-binding NtrC family response regulator